MANDIRNPMNLPTFLRLELKNFLSGKAVILAIACLVLASGYAIFHGRNVIEKQKAIIAQLPAFEAEHFKKQYELSKADLGNLLYYLKHGTVHQPSSWAAFSIGQRDVNPFDVNVTMLTLEGQLYNSEISNPKNLLYGNLDLAFVIVFLFPLVIIAFCHNLISAEQENGIWDLLRAQPTSITTIIGWRLLIRFVTVLLLAISLVTVGGILLESAFDIRFVFAILITVSYLAFWFALAAFVIALLNSSAFNALTLLGVWIFLTILAPALLNLAISTALPVSESFEVTVAQREGYHQKWDQAKAVAMKRFYEIYPQYSSVEIPEDRFSWGWYYAAQLMGDIESSASTENYTQKLQKRDQWTNRIALLLPSVSTQLAFNRLSQNDLESHLAYLQSIRDHHKATREFYYPLIFRNARSDEVDWKSRPRHEFSDEKRESEFPRSVLALLAFTVVFSGLAFWRTRRI